MLMLTMLDANELCTNKMFSIFVP